MQWQGTVEPAGFRDWAVAYPTATDSPTGAMYKVVSSQVCDYNGVGDSDLTSSTTYAGDGSGDAYTTYYEYDSRDCLTGTLAPDGVATIVPDPADNIDNLDEVLQTQSFPGVEL